MKIKVFKQSIVRYCQESELDLLLTAGWQLDPKQAGEETIRLKPPVKSRATVKALEEANINKGDE